MQSLYQLRLLKCALHFLPYSGTYLFVIEQFQFVQKIFHYHKWHVHQSRSAISNSTVIINLFTILIVPTWWSSGASRHFVLFANENQLLSPKCICLALCLLFTCFSELNPGMKWIGMLNSFGNDSSSSTWCVFVQHFVHTVLTYITCLSKNLFIQKLDIEK